MIFPGKTFVKTFFKELGFELRKIPKKPLPWIYADPLEAIHHINQGQPSAIECHVSHCVAFNGFAFGNLGWHPFVETIREHLYSGRCSYAGSFLEKYYATWQPKNAQDALIGAKSGPKKLSEYPSYLIYAPWNKRGINEHLQDLERIAKYESISFTGEEISIKDGYCYQGPVSKNKGQMEYKRLVTFKSVCMEYFFMINQLHKHKCFY